MSGREYFQDHMPGNACFGCGTDNPHGLHIHSYWEGDEGVCQWQPEVRHQGWPGLTCGGIIATLVDCHCMGTAMAHAVRREGRSLGSQPEYRFATGTLTVRYLKPAPIDQPLTLRARVTEIKDERRYTLECRVSVEEDVFAEATVVAFLVWRSDREAGESGFAAQFMQQGGRR